ncbi:MAG: CHRD domain-containing protein [Polyangiales bacterium]
MYRSMARLCLTTAALFGCATTTASTAAHDHGATAPLVLDAVAPPLAEGALDPRRGREVGMVFEAFLSPMQEPDEEENTPSSTPSQFRSTAPSRPRAQREAEGHRGHGIVRFDRALSRAFIDVRIEGVDPSTVNMFHIHCGRPGILGPILVDFAHATDLRQNLADGTLRVEINHEHLARTAAHGHGLVGALTAGCVIPSPSLGGPGPTRVSTIAGMAQIAMEGELYFNLHTTAQTYFGDIRGQLVRVAP